MTPLLLNDLFEREGTDKGPYAPAYELLLRSRREEIKDVLEVGIGTLIRGAASSMQGYAADHYHPGGSLRAWRDYFPNAEIIGIDVQPDTQFESKRIRTFICDSTDRHAVEEFLEQSSEFDLIIDDGSHISADQLATLANLFPALRAGGLYVIEDIDDNSPIFHRPTLIEPFISGSPYVAICDSNEWGPWKLIAIQRLPFSA